jgi:hypothetical protein
MGTLSSEKEKEISGKLASSMYLIIPAVVLGMGSILLLLFGSGDNLSAIRFELGRLWNNATLAEVAEETVPAGARMKRPLKQVSNDELNAQQVQNMVQNTRSILREAGQRRKTAGLQVEQSPMFTSEITASQATMDMNLVRQALRLSEFPRLVERLNSNTILPLPEKKKSSRYLIGVSMYPAYTFRRMSYDHSRMGTRRDQNSIYGFHQSEAYREENDRPVLNFGASMDLYFHFSERILISSGLGIQTFGEKVRVLRSKDMMDLSGVSPQAINMDQKSIYYAPEGRSEESKAIPFINNYTFLQLPMMLNYRTSQAKYHATDLQAGIGVNYLISADAVLYDFDCDVYRWTNDPADEIFRRFTAVASAGAVWRSYFSETAEVFANPQVHYTIGSMFSENYPVRQNPYAFGLRFGLRVHL